MTRELFDPSKKPVKTITPDGVEHDSGLEARVWMYTTVKLGIKWTHRNSLSFIMETYGGQYKPDYVRTMPDGSMSVVEVKGWLGDRVTHIMELMAAKVDDPGDPVSEYSVIWSKGIEYYNGTTEDYVPGAFYVCPNCGQAWILPKHSHDCPQCGTRCDYDLCSVNDKTRPDGKYSVNDHFNRWWKETGWGPVWEKWLPQWIAQQEQRKKSEELDASYKRALFERYPELNLHDQSKNRELTFLTRFAFNGTYTPELFYTEPRANVQRFGTALDPIAVVIIQDFHDNYLAALMRQMDYFVNDLGCPVVKVVHIDHRGIHVCDKHNPLGFVDGAIYRCDKCGKEYFAPRDHRECPCCDSASTKKLSK